MPKATGEPVGCCGIVFSNNVDKAAKGLNEAETGYWIGKSYWGKGMIPEAVRVHVHSCSAQKQTHALVSVNVMISDNPDFPLMVSIASSYSIIF